MIAGDVVKDYLSRFPNTPSLTLAKLIYQENANIFKTIESVRSTVRYYRGQKGIKDRKCVSKQITTKPWSGLPKGLTAYDDWEPVKIPGNNILILADIHAPYHDRESLETALNHGDQKNIDCILFLGDFSDFYSVSAWTQDPDRVDLRGEIDQAKLILSVIIDYFKDIPIYLLAGNHEDRLNRYIQRKCPELWGMEELTYESVMNLKAFGVEYVADKKILQIGKLNLIHGHEFSGGAGSPVNPARGLYNKGKAMSMCGHFHRTSEHAEMSMTGDAVTCWSVGHLGDAHPSYAPINKWNRGFARVERQEKGNFVVYNHKIIEGKVY